MLHSLDMYNYVLQNHVHTKYGMYVCTTIQSYATFPFLKSIGESIRGWITVSITDIVTEQ